MDRVRLEGAFTAKQASLIAKSQGTFNPMQDILRREGRAAQAAALTLRGLTQEEVAEQLGIGRQTVAEDLKLVRKTWLDSSLVAYDAIRAEQLAKLNEIERRQWEAIEALEAVEGEKAEGDWWYKRHNAAWTRIVWAFEQKCKIFGLYAPQEVISWKAEAQAQGFDPETIYRVLVHEMANIIDGQVTVVQESNSNGHNNGDGNGSGSGEGDRGSAFLAEPVETDAWPD